MTPEPTRPIPIPAPASRQQALTAGLDCYYADPARRNPRPHCERVAVVAYGTIVLCSACDKMRSAVGKGVAPRALPGAELHQLIAAAQALAHAEHHLNDAVRLARRAGASWGQIGDALGVTRQAAQQRWSPQSTAS